jgi:hypothetical protein
MVFGKAEYVEMGMLNAYLNSYSEMLASSTLKDRCQIKLD